MQPTSFFGERPEPPTESPSEAAVVTLQPTSFVGEILEPPTESPSEAAVVTVQPTSFVGEILEPPTESPSEAAVVTEAPTQGLPSEVPSLAPTSSPTALTENPSASKSPSTLIIDPTSKAPTKRKITPRPSQRPTQAPTSEGVASICVISSIPSRFNQSQWSGTDAALAMKQAISLTMGEPVANINVGYANQLCLTSPTMSPSFNPTSTPTSDTLRKLNTIEEIYKASASSATSSISSEEISVAAVAFIPLSFSIYKVLPGDYHRAISLNPIY